MLGKGTLEHCRPLFIELEIQTVINLYIFDLAKYIIKNRNLLNPTSTIHNYHTRRQNNTYIQFHRLSKTMNSHIVIALKVFNSVENVINRYSDKQFETKFYSWLLQNPFYNIEEFFKVRKINFD